MPGYDHIMYLNVTKKKERKKVSMDATNEDPK